MMKLLFVKVMLIILKFVLTETLDCEHTVGGPSGKYVKCQFPFKFRNKIFFECTNETDPEGFLWCSTKTDLMRNHVGGQGFWGFCNQNCKASKSTSLIVNLTTESVTSTQIDNAQKIKVFKANDCDTKKGDCLPNYMSGECGISFTSGYIVGGINSTYGKYPFMALIGYNRKENVVEFACGGSLINRKYVLTAAHCQNTKSLHETISLVRLGEFDVSKKVDCQGCPLAQDFQILPSDVLVHENWRLSRVKSQGNDIALIRLPRLAITVHENSDYLVLPICLSWKKTIKEEEITKYTIAGWGKVTQERHDKGDFETSGVFNEILQEAEVFNVEIKECKSTHGYFTLDPKRHICAGGLCGKTSDSCNGDSGGPLFVSSNMSNSQILFLRGIVSFGTSVCGIGVPGVYTNIDYYMPWIYSHIKN